MELSDGRVDGYLGALAAGLAALAPSANWPDVHRATAHLQALHPQLSGTLLGPAEIDDQSGLPDFSWMDRARSQHGAANHAVSDEEIALARRHDPALAERLAARQRIAAHLDAHPLLPAQMLQVLPRRRGRTEDFTLILDATVPARGWMRLKVDLTGIAGWYDDQILRLRGARAEPGAGLSRLLRRHQLTGLDALRVQLRTVLGAEVTRLSRGWLGPFWFPGLPGTAGAPVVFRERLSLHASLEVLGREVRTSGCRDPLAGSRPEPPPGHGRWLERRIAATGALEELRQWWGRHTDVGVLVSLQATASARGALR